LLAKSSAGKASFSNSLNHWFIQCHNSYFTAGYTFGLGDCRVIGRAKHSGLSCMEMVPREMAQKRYPDNQERIPENLLDWGEHDQQAQLL
jgi:hypothetical protein